MKNKKLLTVLAVMMALVVLAPQIQAAEELERCILVSTKGNVIRAKSAKTEETLFKNSDAKKVIEWALENGRCRKYLEQYL